MHINFWTRKVRTMTGISTGIFFIMILYKIINQPAQNLPNDHLIRDGQEKTTPLLLPLPDASRKVDKWLIINCDTHPMLTCNDISHIFIGWSIVFSKPPNDKNGFNPRCHYLTNEIRSKRHLYTATDFLAASLMAIKEGADVIFVLPEKFEGTNDETVQIPDPTQLLQEGIMVNTTETIFDIHYWQRCKASLDNKHYNGHNLCSNVPVSLIYFDNYLDSSIDTGRPAIRAPPVILPSGVFNPQLPSCVIFFKNAFWALPVLTVIDPDDRWLINLAIQKLLWDTGQYTEIFNSQWSGHKYLQSPDHDKFSIKKITTALNNWKCRDDNCAIKLLQFFEDSTMLATADIINEFKEWLSIVPRTMDEAAALKYDSVVCNPIVYEPSEFCRKDFRKRFNILEIESLYMNTCTPKHTETSINTKTSINFAKPWFHMDNIVLLIIFNNPHYDVIPYLELLYRAFFPHILYCGPGFPDLETYPQLQRILHSFLSYGDTPSGHSAGVFNYKCTIMAMQIGYQVDGYLIIADDLLIFPHHFPELSTRTFWYLPQHEIRIGAIKKLRECRLGMCDFYPHWHWWEDYQQVTISALEQLRTKQTDSVAVNQCYRQLVYLNGAEFRANGAYSDIYYIPNNYAKQFRELAEIFLENQVFLEIAIPTIINCLALPEDRVNLKGTANWEVDRDEPWLFFKSKYLVGKRYLHPTKWGFLTATKTFTTFLCDSVLPYLHDVFERTRRFD